MNTERYNEIILITEKISSRLRESYFIKSNYELYDRIVTYTKDLNLTFKQRIYHYVYEIRSYVTCLCGNTIKMKKNWEDGYVTGCSVKCRANNSYVRDKTKKTNLDRYGVDNPSKSLSIKDKISEINISKYGFKSSFQSDIVRINYKKNLMDKYGVDNPMKSIEFRKEYKVTKSPYYVRYLDRGISLYRCDCGKDHEFEIHLNNYNSRFNRKLPLCTVCHPIGDNRSIKEQMLFEYIRSVYLGEIVQSYRDKLEVDIFLPELNIGFEFNGLYWHSDKYLENDYHVNKYNYFQEKGIQLYFIWEDDWDYKREIVESKINNVLFVGDIVDSDDIRLVCGDDVYKFLSENSLVVDYVFDVSVGLYFSNDLVGLMLFNNIDNNWCVSLYCEKFRINCNKIIEYFCITYDIEELFIIDSNDWSFINLFPSKYLEDIDSNYYGVIDGRRLKCISDINVYDAGYKKYKLLFD